MLVCPRRMNNDDGTCKHHMPATEEEPGFCKLPSQFQCIDMIAARSPRLSHSSVLDWIKCRKLFYLKAIRGVQKRPEAMGKALKMGALWDVCQGKMYGRHGNEEIYKVIDEYQIEEMEVSIVRAMVKAANKLGLAKPDDECQLQERFVFKTTFEKIYPWNTEPGFDFLVTGVYDRLYGDYFAENKFTSRPDNYLDVFNLTSQVGTYFLSNSALKYCIMEVVRAPSLRAKEDEEPEQFGARLYEDVMKRPGFYFIGYKNGAYGKKFFRNEFNLENLALRYKNIAFEVMDAAARDAFYGNETACTTPWECDMLEICKSGVVSDTLYRYRDKVSEERSALLAAGEKF